MGHTWRRTQKLYLSIRRSDFAYFWLCMRLGGMVVVCAGTTGYNVTLDLVSLDASKKTTGSHVANDEEANAVNELVIQKS